MGIKEKSWKKFLSFYLCMSLVVTLVPTLIVKAAEETGESSTSASETSATDVVVSQTELGINLGDTTTLTATVTPGETSQDVIWSSSNENVATVDENGVVTGVGNGTADIIATTLGGAYSGACSVTVSSKAEQDATLSSICIDGEPLYGFSYDQYEYMFNVVIPPNGQTSTVPEVTATPNQPGATVNITNATEIPGATTIEVTAIDGVTKATYTINFVYISNFFFDDFNYETSVDPTLTDFGWVVQDGTGLRPGNAQASWSKEYVTFEDDASDPGDKYMRLKATTDGTPTGTVQSQIRYSQEKFEDGTYVAKVYFTDANDEGLDIYRDQIVETFFIINRIQYSNWLNYLECDFEYLPNGGWGSGSNTFFFTTWKDYGLDSSGKQYNAHNPSQSEVKSYEGWHILEVDVDNGNITYYVDGVSKGGTTDGDYQPMSIAFNIWFASVSNPGPTRTYHQLVDWVFYSPNVGYNSADVEKMVADLNTCDVESYDDIAAPDVTLSSLSVDGEPVEGFSSQETDYTVTLPITTDTAGIPTIVATPTSEHSIVTIEPPTSLPGTATVVVQSSDMSLEETYHVNFVLAGDDTLLPPVSDVGSSSYIVPKYVSLSSVSPDAEIYYTTDGSDPTTSSNLYTTPIFVESSQVIKAICVDGEKTSDVATFEYSIVPITPTYMPQPIVSQNTGTYSGSVQVDIAAATPPLGYLVCEPEIYYTTDGSDPVTNPNGTAKLYTEPLTFTETTTIRITTKAPGIVPSNYAAGDAENGKTKFTYTITPATDTTGAPKASLQSGTYDGTQFVTMNSSEGTTIYYTTDGSEPIDPTSGITSPSAKIYSEPIKMTESTTIKAVAVKDGENPSNVVRFDYTINPILTEAPTANLQSGEYFGPINVELSCPTAGAEIYYTTDGSNPATSLTVKKYETPIEITQSTTLNVMAMAPDMSPSETLTLTYTISAPSHQR